MFELRPYRNNNHMTTYDPFRDMEALERAFFGNRDFLGDVGTFKTDIQGQGRPITCSRRSARHEEGGHCHRHRRRQT